MSPAILLDTCALIWIAEGEPIADVALHAINTLWDDGETLWVSRISAWEVGLLAARGRLILTMPPDQWWVRVVEHLKLGVADLPPEVLIASSFLPGDPPRDPADRILAATARQFGYQLMTRDSKLINYAEAGYLLAVSC